MGYEQSGSNLLAFRICNDKWDEQVLRIGETVTDEKAIAEPHRGRRRPARVEMTIGIDLGDVWSHYCTLNEKGEVVDCGRFRTSPKGVEKWFTDLPPARARTRTRTGPESGESAST